MIVGLVITYLLLSLIGGLFLAQFCARQIVKILFNNILTTLKELELDSKVLGFARQEIEKEKTIIEAIEIKKDKIGWITKIVGSIEFLVFYGASYLLLMKNNLDLTDTLIHLSTLLGAWMALKTIGNYSQWSSHIFGRAWFYTFFLGTITNVFIAVALGLIWKFIL